MDDSSPATHGEFFDVVFDGPPGPECGRFVEVENEQGASISVGKWVLRPDGYWALRIQRSAVSEIGAPLDRNAIIEELLKSLNDMIIEADMPLEPSVAGTGDYDQGLMCGVEDRGLQANGYEAMRYGYDRALERVSEYLDPIIEELKAVVLKTPAPEGGTESAAQQVAEFSLGEVPATAPLPQLAGAAPPQPTRDEEAVVEAREILSTDHLPRGVYLVCRAYLRAVGEDHE